MDYYINIIEYNFPSEKIKRNVKRLMRQQHLFFKHVFDSPILNKKGYYVTKHNTLFYYIVIHENYFDYTLFYRKINLKLI
jgi:hypothetical protein